MEVNLGKENSQRYCQAAPLARWRATAKRNLSFCCPHRFPPLDRLDGELFPFTAATSRAAATQCSHHRGKLQGLLLCESDDGPECAQAHVMGTLCRVEARESSTTSCRPHLHVALTKLVSGRGCRGGREPQGGREGRTEGEEEQEKGWAGAARAPPRSGAS